MKKGFRLYFKLFLTMLYISAFTFGGGYVIISLMRKKFVEDFHWIEEKEILELTAISQSSPGSIAVNASVMIGYRMAGKAGIAVCVLATVLPPLIILSVISAFYNIFIESAYVKAVLKGMNAGVAAIVCDAAFSFGKNIAKDKSVFSISVMLLSFVAVFFFSIDVKMVIIICAAAGLLKMKLSKNRGEAK